MTSRLTLSAAVASAAMAHARADLPNEACGLVSGDIDSGRGTTFHPARNADASPYAFTVDPADLVRLVLGIEAAGEGMLAIFHSHPRTPAVPSARDIAEHAYPALHLVATLSEGAGATDALRAWRIDDGRAVEIALAIE